MAPAWFDEYKQDSCIHTEIDVQTYSHTYPSLLCILDSRLTAPLNMHAVSSSGDVVLCMVMY